MVDENDDESFHSNSSSPSQQFSPSSNVASRVRQNPSHESHDLNTLLSETITFQAQQRNAHRDGLRSIGQALKNMMGGKRKWNDILLIGNDIPTLQSVKDWLGKCFAMKDLEDATYILGIKIYRDRSKRLIGLSQDTHLDKILKRFRMENYKKGNLPLHYGIKIKSTYQNPGEGHWTAVKNILKYLRNTKDMFLVYGGEELRVTGYCDASWKIDKDDSHSHFGWVFLLNEGAMTWKSSKQDTVADSTCESKDHVNNETSNAQIAHKLLKAPNNLNTPWNWMADMSIQVVIVPDGQELGLD
ncbi:retrotransposon protein, putative, ty1-copia subclass [Tanacetum coccineum]